MVKLHYVHKIHKFIKLMHKLIKVTKCLRTFIMVNAMFTDKHARVYVPITNIEKGLKFSVEKRV